MSLQKFQKNSLFNFIFFGYLFFTGTTLKLTLGLDAISAVVFLMVLLSTSLIFVFNFNQSNFSTYEIFILLIASSLFLVPILNLLLQGISYIGVVETIVFIFPWMVLISVLTSKNYILNNYKKFWDWFNFIIIVLTFLGILEFIACFYFGVVPPFEQTPNGVFLVGKFTVFHPVCIGGIGDGAACKSELYFPHFRFYGPFGEPGDMGMWGVILLFYNLFRKKYFYSIIFLTAIILSYSPAPIISILIALIIFSFRSSSYRQSFILNSFLIMAVVYFNVIIIEFFTTVLQQKVFTVGVRTEQTVDFFKKIIFLINVYPIGFPFFATDQALQEAGLDYQASFRPVLAFGAGGLLTFICYIAINLCAVIKSLWTIFSVRCQLIDKEEYFYFLIAFPYILQRQTVLEFGIFSLLFGRMFITSRNRTGY